MNIQPNVSEPTTEMIFRKFYGPDTFIEKAAIPKEYGFVSKKKGSSNDGYPDFFKLEKDFCIIVEAKKLDHQKAEQEVKFYMSENKITIDLIGIAISGQDLKTLQVTYFIKETSTNEIHKIEKIDSLLSIEDIKKVYKSFKYKNRTTIEHLNSTLKSLNTQFHNEDIVRDTERSLFFSGIMIALKDKTFRREYMLKDVPEDYTGAKLLEAHLLNEAIIDAIDRQLKGKINNLSKEYNWKDKFSFIKTIDYPLIKYKKMIKQIEEEIFVPFENEEKQDILAKAYKIFLSKAGKVDNKNIIITPDHIKSLMVQLARLSINDVVCDTCMGTGGFLMESMEEMIKMTNDPNTIKRIKEEQLIGFEIDSVLFALACSNMFLHGDGRTKLIYRSSLLGDEHENIVNSSDSELLLAMHTFGINKIIINPPYENNKPIKFVLQALEYLQPEGKLIIIMPTPTLTHNQGSYDLKTGILKKAGLTEKVLANAKLDFVIKCPEKLFSEQNRTVNTSIFGFTKTPHKNDDTVLFYNLSDDGFISIQHKGRIDKDGKWKERQDKIYAAIRDLDEIKGISEKRKIYDEKGILNCAGFKKQKANNRQLFRIGDLFNVEKGTLASENANEDGDIDFITASSEWKKHTSATHDCEAIILAIGAGGSLGRTHYVNGKFIASNLCLILKSKNDPNHPIDMQFYNFYFKSIRDELKNDLADGTSKLTIRQVDLMNYYIEYIPYDEQLLYRDTYIKQYISLREQLIKAEKELKSKISLLSS